MITHCMNCFVKSDYFCQIHSFYLFLFCFTVISMINKTF